MGNTGSAPPAATIGGDVDPYASSSTPGLAHGQLRFVRTVALSVGIQGPVAGVIVGPAILAGLVGGSGALAYLLGLVAMSFVAYAFIVFARSFNSAGSIYAFNAAALGPTYGFISAWILLLVYLSFAAAVYASTADIAQTLVASWGVHVSWVWLALAGFSATMLFAHRSIRFTTAVIFAVEGVAVALVGVGVVVVVVHHGVGRALSAAPFGLHGLGLGALALGVVNAFGAFSGFEGAATLGEESTEATRTIPRAIGWSLAGSALVYIVVTWIVDNAYRSPHALAADPAPIVHLADLYVGSWMGTVVNAAGVVSAFGAQLACVVAANRLIFALGRDVAPEGGALRRLLTRVHPRFRSPSGALAVSGTLTLVALLAFSKEASAVRALTLIVELGAYLIIVAYLLTVVGAGAWVLRRDRRPGPVVALALGTLVLAAVLYDTLHPFPPAPFDWIVVAAGLAVAAGLVLAFAPGVRRRLAVSPLLVAVRRAPRLPPAGAQPG